MALPEIKEEPVDAEAFSPETLAAIQQLNVDPSNARFMLLVQDLLRPESLPRGWTAEFKAGQKKWDYTDQAGQKHDKHPVYDYYIGAMFMDLGGYAQLKAIAAARPPTAEEIQQMGQYFGIKPDEEKYIWEVAEMGLCAPLPPGWKEHVVEQQGQEPSIAFRNDTTGEVQQEHPLDNYFRELIRRRRRELLRRKKAALKSLQALIKMGMGRRGLLAAAVKAGTSSNSTEVQTDKGECDVETFSPETQAALQAAWESVLGTASELVQCMQAAAWDGLTGLAPTAASVEGANLAAASTSSSSANAGDTGDHDSKGGSISGVSKQQTAMQERLQQLSAVLAGAAGPSALDPFKMAGTALADIQRLAAATAAAGSDADVLAAVLAEQGINLPDYGSTIADLDEDSDVSQCLWPGLNPRPSEGADRSSQRVSGIGQGSVLDSAAAQVTGSGRSSLNGRPSRTSLTGEGGTDSAESMQPRRPSLLGDALPFVGATGATASMAGTASTSGAGSEPWSLAGGKPDAAGQAAAAAARSTAAAHAAGADGVPAARASSAAASRFSFGQAFDAATAKAAGVFKKRRSSTGAGTATVADVSSSAQAASRADTGTKSVTFADTGSTNTVSATPEPGSLPPGSQPAEAAAAANATVSSLVHGVELPPAADAAVQHLAALQEVMQQALGLIKSWQQQRVIIALLQHRVQETAARASMSQRRLAAARRELQQMQAKREQGLGDAGAVTQQCNRLSEQLQQAQQQLAEAVADKQGLQLRLEGTLAELASSKDALDKLQAESGSDAAAAAAEASALAKAHKQLQESTQKLQEELQTVQVAVITGQQRCEQLDQHLAAVSAQLQQEQAEKQEVLVQLQHAEEEFAALQAKHDQLLASTGSEAAAASAELSELKGSMQVLQEKHAVLQDEHAAVLASLTTAQDQQQRLQTQLGQTQQQLSELQAAHAALQAEHTMQGQQLQETQQALKALQELHAQQGAELSTAQKQLSALQGSHATAMQQQETLQADLSSTKAELAAVQAAAQAAEAKRAAMPRKHTQVAATDHADAHWVRSKGVQTGEELDPKSTRDVGTPADLSLLSYFFREIKQKQRGGGGAIFGYDPAEAANAAAGPDLHTAKSWSGGTGLPPISGSPAKARDSKSAAATRSTSPTPMKQAATMPGTLRGAKAPEEEEDEGGFSTRPPSWEVRQKVDRRRDRAIKLEGGKHSADGDKWDYAIEERDAEITELKRRLVEAEHKAREAATKAAEELRVMGAELQTCKRSLEQVQAENFTLNKDLVTLKLTMQAVEAAADGSTVAAAAAIGSLDPSGAPRASRFSIAGLSGLKPGGARVSTAPGAYGDAGLGLTSPVPRASVALLGSSQGTGVLGGGQGALGGSRVSTAYGTGRLSSLPAQFPAQNAAGQLLSPYAAAGGSRKSMVTPPPQDS